MLSFVASGAAAHYASGMIHFKKVEQLDLLKDNYVLRFLKVKE